jgi:HK97 family phage prohead protease
MSEFNIKGLERRYVTQQIEERSEGGQNYVRGHAAVFNSSSGTNLAWVETIAPGAFAKSIADPSNDCICAINHDPNQILGRRKNGTLQLKEDGIGLFFQNLLPDTSYARDLLANIRNRNIKGCSFSFVPKVQEWSRDGNGNRTRELREVSLVDVSCVTNPVYEATDLSSDDRGAFDVFKEEWDDDGDSDEAELDRMVTRMVIAGFPGGLNQEMRSLFAEKIWKRELDKGQSTRVRRTRLHKALQF